MPLEDIGGDYAEPRRFGLTRHADGCRPTRFRTPAPMLEAFFEEENHQKIPHG